MTQIYAYVGFAGQCREAMTFYQECIGGELFLQTIAESPIADQCPEGIQGEILHSSLTKGPLILMGTDMVGPQGYTKGTNVALSLNCSSEEEINTFFEKLSAGGTILDPLKPQFWGAIFGAFTDKFGIGWMLNYTKNGQ
jgi:PhnB protein